MSSPTELSLWADPMVVYPVAVAAVALLLATLWLFRRPKRRGRQAGAIFLALSVGLHLLLFVLIPIVTSHRQGGGRVDPERTDSGTASIRLETFDPEMQLDAEASRSDSAPVDPLPVANLIDLLDAVPESVAANAVAADPPAESHNHSESVEPTAPFESVATDESREPGADIDASRALVADRDAVESVPSSLSGMTRSNDDTDRNALDDAFTELFDQAPAPAEPSSSSDVSSSPDVSSPSDAPGAREADSAIAAADNTDNTDNPDNTGNVHDGDQDRAADSAAVAGDRQSDFANRVGSAKEEALRETGGDADTEAAVEAALRFLSRGQRSDGGWDPAASGAGVERAPLGETRDGAGKRAESAITGLALLALMGAGHTHREGDHADNVFRGLVYLIRIQKPDGSLAGNASLYAANYSHGMAALAMAEAAAITGDPAAIEATRRAVAHTTRMQHPTTGGFRYRQGDAGDLSQLGWQVMVLDGGYRAGLRIDPGAVGGVQRFLRTVQAGTHGGLARYRPGEAPSRTMTAEALATRLLLGERVPSAEIAEAERYLLEQPPGTGQDNYYYWYYATLALHQLQDDAWRQWNDALKDRLLATQRPDGSWSRESVWGGYGGTVYTTAMATLCLEAYYRHAVRSRDQRIANLPDAPARTPRDSR